MCPDSMDFSRHKGASGIYWIVPLQWGMVADGYQPGSSWRACPFISQWCGHNLKRRTCSKKCRSKINAEKLKPPFLSPVLVPCFKG